MDPELRTSCLEAFPKWLASLADDAVSLGSLLAAESLPEVARRHVAGALGYLHKSLDLIPDGVEDVGYVDDAFVLRVAARLALADAPGAKEADIRGILARLAGDAVLVEQLLGQDYARLAGYVRGLARGASRGRTVDEVLGDPAVRADLLRDVAVWARGYQPPPFQKDDKTLVKLTAFLERKLPPA
jgi:uncharacterized membrane protein YkvA (DUF1232 family)